MDEGVDLAVISGSGELPLIIQNLYTKATFITFDNSNTIFENKVVLQNITSNNSCSTNQMIL